jgi:hypothetical protein
VTVRADPIAKIYVSPASINDAVVNNDYTVYLNVANVTDLYAWEFQLDYNSTVLSLISTSVVSGGLNTPTQTFMSSNTAGHLWWAVSTTYPTTTGISYTDHAIFEIQFHAIASGNSNLHIHGETLADHTAAAITHTTADGSITVGTIDLTVTSTVIIDHGCSIYANDVYADGVTPYYVPVNVTIHNAGNMAAGAFHVLLEVYWITGSLADGSDQLAVASLAAGASLTLQFASVFHPAHTHEYRLTATVDNSNEVTESNEANNVQTISGIQVTVIGDVNGSGIVNVLDAVTIAQAWGATPTDGWWNIRADINHDGMINILDGGRMTLHWGETW